MGNSTNYEEIRSRTIKERNERLDKFLITFQNIIKEHKITPQKIDYLTRLDLPSLVK